MSTETVASSVVQ